MPDIKWHRKSANPGEQREMKREVVLREAAKAFYEKGFHRTSLDSLAKGMNLTKPALYYYIKNKDDLLLECTNYALELLENLFLDVEKKRANGMEKLRYFFSEYAALAQDPFGKCLAVYSDRPVLKHNRQLIRDKRSETQDRVMAIVAGGIKDGSINPCEPELVAKILFATFNDLHSWYRPNGALTLQQITDRLLDTFCKGIAPSSRTD